MTMKMMMTRSTTRKTFVVGQLLCGQTCSDQLCLPLHPAVEGLTA